jgi:Uma2 family endonuclease
MSIAATISTAQELLKAGDIGRCELVRGKLVMMTPAGAEHGWIANRIAYLLTRFVTERDLGGIFAAETGFQIASTPDTVRAPDVAFVSKERLARELAKGFWQGPPDLAVEVLSPGDTASEMQAKVQDWLRAGTGQVWVVDPAHRTISIYRPSAPVEVFTDSDELKVADLLPGLRLIVANVFP